MRACGEPVFQSRRLPQKSSLVINSNPNPELRLQEACCRSMALRLTARTINSICLLMMDSAPRLGMNFRPSEVPDHFLFACENRPGKVTLAKPFCGRADEDETSASREVTMLKTFSEGYVFAYLNRWECYTWEDEKKYRSNFEVKDPFT